MAFFIVKRYGMNSGCVYSRTHPSADAIEVDERTFRCAERLALLHRSSCFGVSVHMYRVVTKVGVMVFAKMRQSVSIHLKIA